jgi:hypothetical protein
MLRASDVRSQNPALVNVTPSPRHAKYFSFTGLRLALITMLVQDEVVGLQNPKQAHRR